MGQVIYLSARRNPAGCLRAYHANTNCPASTTTDTEAGAPLGVPGPDYLDIVIVGYPRTR